MLNALKEQFRRAAPDIVGRLTHHAERGRINVGELHVVEADERELFRDAHFAFCDDGEGANRGKAAACEESRWRFSHIKKAGGLLAATLLFEFSDADELFFDGDAGQLMSVAVALEAATSGRGIAGTGDDAEAAMAAVDEVLDGVECSAAVVDPHAIDIAICYAAVDADHGQAAAHKLANCRVVLIERWNNDAVDRF